MNNKHRSTLDDVFANPVKASIPWRDVEKLFEAAGGTVTAAAGSRVTVELNGEDAVFHRPHPQKTTDKGAVKAVRRFLEQAGVTPDSEKEK